jgi:hypothetical protein
VCYYDAAFAFNITRFPLTALESYSEMPDGRNSTSPVMHGEYSYKTSLPKAENSDNGIFAS